MLITRQALSAAHFASTDISRASLNHIRVDPDGTVWGSNGHVALKVTQSPELTNPADFPIVPGIPDTAKSPVHAVLVPASVALDMVKALSKVKRAHIPVLTRAILLVTDTTGYLACTDLERPTVFPFTLTTDKYPRIEEVYPKPNKKQLAQPFGVNAEYLALVAKVEGCFDHGSNRPVKITPYGPQDAISLEWSTGDGLAAHALIMPVRL